MRVSVLAAFAAGLLLASAPAQAQQPIVIKFSHVVTPDTPKGKGAEKFKELAEKYTNGRVKIEIYPNSQLYKDKEEVEALQLGAVQMLAPSLAKFGPLGAKEFEVFDIPYILPDKAALRRVTDGALGKKLFTKLEPKGIKGLAYWDNGFKVMSANKPLRMPDDFRGLKMRIQSAKPRSSRSPTSRKPLGTRRSRLSPTRCAHASAATRSTNSAGKPAARRTDPEMPPHLSAMRGDAAQSFLHPPG